MVMQQDQDAKQRLDRPAGAVRPSVSAIASGAVAHTVRLYFAALKSTASDNPTRARQAANRLRDGVAQGSPRAPLPTCSCH
jgi:hypothetical protein